MDSFYHEIDDLHVMTNNPSNASPYYIHPFPEPNPDGSLVEIQYDETLDYGRATGYYAWVDGIRLRHTVTEFGQTGYFEKSNEEELVSLSFNLEGDYTIFQQDKTYPVQRGQHNLIYTRGFNNTFINHHLRGESFDIAFAPEQFIQMTQDGNPTLQRFITRMQQDQPVVLSQRSIPISFELIQAIRSIINCRYQGHLRKLFLLSKTMEILVLSAETVDRFVRSAPEISLTRDDRERIQQARQYLERHFQNPPSLSELAREVGLNEYKLKRGFKKEYQTTAFGYLADYRLQRSQEALLANHRSIAEVAYDLGYSSPQHFSAAFKKKFGVPPSHCR